jgi:hypothetical protein
LPFAVAMGLAEVPYLIAQALIMGVVAYWMVELQAVAWKWVFFTLTFLLSLAFYVYMGMFFVMATATPMLAQLLAAGINSLLVYFNGFLVPYPQMPAGWQWANRVSPTTWMLYGLGGSQLGDRDDVWVAYSCSPVANPCEPDSTCCLQAGSTNQTAQRMPQFIESYFGYEFDFVWWCLVIVACFVLLFRVSAAVMLAKVSFERR